jgi:hypothetical protein
VCVFVFVCARARARAAAGLSAGRGLGVQEDFFFKERIPPPLANEVRKYKQHLYASNVRAMPEFARTELSNSLLRDFTCHIFRAMLSHLPLFRALDHASIAHIALALEPIQASAPPEPPASPPAWRVTGGGDGGGSFRPGRLCTAKATSTTACTFCRLPAPLSVN